MLKKLLFVATAVAIALSVSAQGTHKRRVMVEEFTNASCPPCASNNPPFNATLVANADKVTPLKYQVWWPGFDPMYEHNKADVAVRVAYYEVSGVPNGVENGTNFGVPGGYSDVKIDEAYNTLTPVTINVTHEVIPDFSGMKVTVKVKSDDEISGNLRLRVAITEEDIVFAAAPGTNGEKEFSSVMKKMLPNAEGTEITGFTAGEEKTYTFTWAPGNYYNLNKIGVVAWLQDDDTKDVWQSNLSAPNTQIEGGNFGKVQLTTAQLAKLTCTTNFVPTFTLKNLAPVGITSADILYNVDGGAWLPFKWTGTLNSNITTPVTLPEVVFDKPGTHQVKVQITNTSAGLQLNQVDGSNTALVHAMFGTKPIPSINDFEGASFPPEGFGIKNEGNNGWKYISQASGAFGSSAKSLACDFYNIPVGKTVELYFPRMDLTGVTSAKLTFDHAKVHYSATDIDDRLRVDVSVNCGANWTTVFDKKGAALSTAPLQTAQYLPADDEWVSNEIDFTPYVGQAEVLVRLRGTSDFGNNLYMDNINVTTTSGVNNVPGLANATIINNPTASTSELRFALEQPQSLSLMVYSVEGTLAQSLHLGDLPAGDHVAPLDASQLPSGSYRVVLQGKTGLSQMQWIVLK